MKRGLGAAIMLSASLALAGCNSPKPNPILNKTPAAETIMDSGVKEVKKPEKPPESKLADIPAKVGEEPAKSNATPASVLSSKAEKSKWAPLPIIKTTMPAQDKTDPASWYDVDSEGKPIHEKGKNTKKD